MLETRYAADPGVVEGLEGRINEMMATGYLPKRVELNLSHGMPINPLQILPLKLSPLALPSSLKIRNAS